MGAGKTNRVTDAFPTTYWATATLAVNGHIIDWNWSCAHGPNLRFDASPITPLRCEHVLLDLFGGDAHGVCSLDVQVDPDIATKTLSARAVRTTYGDFV